MLDSILDSLPLFGTVAAGPVIAAIVVFLIKNGLVKQSQAAIATLLLVIGWCVLALVLDLHPGLMPIVVAVLEFIGALVGAAGAYSFRSFGTKALSLD